MAIATLRVITKGAQTFSSATSLPIDTGQIQYIVEASNYCSVVVQNNNVLEIWKTTTTYAATKTIIDTVAANQWFETSPTKLGSTTLKTYRKVLIPYAAISYCKGDLLAFLVNERKTEMQVSGGTVLAATLYTAIVSASLSANFTRVSSLTSFRGGTIKTSSSASMRTVILNNTYISLIANVTLGVRTYQYQFATGSGLVVGSEVHTYTMTSPTFGASDTLNGVTTRAVGLPTPVTNGLGTLPMQTALNKAAIKTALDALILAANESSGTITVAGNATSMVITIPNCTWIFVNAIEDISSVLTFTSFVVT